MSLPLSICIKPHNRMDHCTTFLYTSLLEELYIASVCEIVCAFIINLQKYKLLILLPVISGKSCSIALINMYPTPPSRDYLGQWWGIYFSFDNNLVPGGGVFDSRTNARAPRVRLSLLPLSVFSSRFSFKRKACTSRISAILSLSSPSARKQFVSYSSVPTYHFRTRLCYLLDCRTRLCLWLSSKYSFYVIVHNL